jgi:hypothetical protein
MLKNWWFYLFLVLSLIGLVGFSSKPSQVTSRIVFGADPPLEKAVPAVQQVTAPLGEYCPFTAQELQSLHTVTISSNHEPMLETSDGPIGYDGGIYALSQCRFGKTLSEK